MGDHGEEAAGIAAPGALEREQKPQPGLNHQISRSLCGPAENDCGSLTRCHASLRVNAGPDDARVPL